MKEPYSKVLPHTVYTHSLHNMLFTCVFTEVSQLLLQSC